MFGGEREGAQGVWDTWQQPWDLTPGKRCPVATRCLPGTGASPLLFQPERRWGPWPRKGPGAASPVSLQSSSHTRRWPAPQGTARKRLPHRSAVASSAACPRHPPSLGGSVGLPEA